MNATLTKRLSAAEIAAALRAARGQRLSSADMPCGIRYLTLVRPVRPATPAPRRPVTTSVLVPTPVSVDEPTTPVEAATPVAQLGDASPTAIRAWADAVGLDCPVRGRIPHAVKAAYNDAQWYRARRQGIGGSGS
jgi:hypothetical protein